MVATYIENIIHSRQMIDIFLVSFVSGLDEKLNIVIFSVAAINVINVKFC